MFDIEGSSSDFYEDIPMYYKSDAETEMESLTNQLTTSKAVTTICNKTNSIRIQENTNFSSCKIPDITVNTSENCLAPQEFNSYYSAERSTLKRTFGQHFCSHGLSGVKKSIKKRKRKRTMFTTEQIIALEEVFRRNPYINREERKGMSINLNITEKSIKVWFQNRRRLTDKQSTNYISDSPSSEDISDTISDRLAFIDAQIEQNTDKNGYVRLDNETMRELVRVIDLYLSQDVDPVEEVVHPVISESKVIYEPISPVSLTDNLDEVDRSIESVSQETEQFSDIKSILFY